jgi:hypothetical protein
LLEFVELNRFVLLRATKHYRLTAIGEDADSEIYSRDVGALQAYLTAHFEELHIWLFSVRDITPNMALNRIQQRNSRHTINADNTNPDELPKRL